MARLFGGSLLEKKPVKAPLWCAEYEHQELDNYTRNFVKTRSYTPWVPSGNDVVDIVGLREGTIKKLFKRDNTGITIATAQGLMPLDQVQGTPDTTQLTQPNKDKWSAEDLTLD